jgi:hypothetical protein
MKSSMDLETKKAADREYVDRFFRGVASKLMTHPYFSKFANQANMSADVSASVARLNDVIAAYKNKMKPSTSDDAARKESLKTYIDNMKLVYSLIRKRQELEINRKDVLCKDFEEQLIKNIKEIEGHIQTIYGSANKKDLDLTKYDICTKDDKAIKEKSIKEEKERKEAQQRRLKNDAATAAAAASAAAAAETKPGAFARFFTQSKDAESFPEATS